MAFTAKLDNTPGNTNLLGIESSTFNNGLGDWVAYAEAAPGTAPTDGTGGSPLLSVTRTTTSPLKDFGSLLFTKGNSPSTLQGEGASVVFNVPTAYKASVLSIEFDYIINSGTFVAGSDSVAGDVTVWLYDIDNTTIIQPTPYKLTSSSTTTPGKFKSTFQTSANGTQYRLILHKGSTNTADFSLKFDNFKIGPQPVVYGVPSTDWSSFTPTGAWTTNTTYTGRQRRVGDSLEMEARVALAGAPNSATFTINLPSGLSMDTTKISDASAGGSIFGNASAADGANVHLGNVTYSSSTALRVYGDDATSIWNETNPFTFGSGDSVYLTFKVPIAGWSSNVQMSNDASTRIVAAKYTSSATNNITTSGLVIPQSTVIYDTHAALNGSGVFTCPVSGKYKVSGSYSTSSTASSAVGNLWAARIYKNGTGNTYVGVQYTQTTTAYRKSPGGSAEIDCNAGDTLEVRQETNDGTTHAYAGNTDIQWVSFEYLSGPSAVAASEKVYLQYITNGGTALTANTTNIDFITKVTDSHNAWNGTVFTAPRSGFYIIQGMIRTSANTTSQLGLYVNGTEVLNMTDDVSENYKTFAASRYVNGGDTISIRTDTAATLQAGNTDNWISIYSQG